MKNEDQLQKIREARFQQFLLRDKNPYICYRFTVALEELLPKELSQIALVVDDKAEIADRMIVELEPEGVYQRYLKSILKKPYYFWQDFKELDELAHQYMRYLDSNQEDRLYYYSQNKDFWDKFI